MMSRCCFLAVAIAIAGCASIEPPDRFVGTYFRVPTVHDEPSGKLILSEDRRFSFLSVLSQTLDPETNAPHVIESFGSWSVVKDGIDLVSDEGDEFHLKFRSSAKPVKLEWNSILYVQEAETKPAR